MNSFNFASTPKIIFGSEKLKELPQLLSKYNSILLLCSNSFIKTSKYKNLLHELKNKNVYSFTVIGEPTPQLVDNIASYYKVKNIEIVISIGGGSVLDCGKAVSAMMTVSDNVLNYLEGFEIKKHPGTKLPFIAIPTSSGTGSEMTKNAVLRSVSDNGFKKSLRHDNFIPDIAIIDPTLTLSCPKNITAYCGLDALTHLLESYLSTNASPMTDALAISGIEYFSNSFIDTCFNGYENLKSREDMAYTSMLSGICLANAGLGTVHGFASSLGGFFKIPHGVVCATLLPPCTKYTIDRLIENEYDNLVYLKKFQKVGEILSNKKSTSIYEGCNLLIDILYNYLEELNIEKLSHYGVTESDFNKIVKNTSNKLNPISLSDEDLYNILLERI